MGVLPEAAAFRGAGHGGATPVMLGQIGGAGCAAVEPVHRVTSRFCTSVVVAHGSLSIADAAAVDAVATEPKLSAAGQPAD